MLKRVDKIFTSFDVNVFYVAEDVRSKQRGIFPETQSLLTRMRPGK